MAMLFFLALLTICAADPEDLQNKMFTFPKETNTDHVTLNVGEQDFGAVTVCFRSFTDLTRDHSLFSLSTPSYNNDLLVYWTAEVGFSLSVRNSAVIFPGLNYKVNTWHSVCFTWDSVSGVGQLWLDGKHSTRKYITSGSNITGNIIIVLGQEQDSREGAFDAKQSFLGMMSDVHMWDHIIPRQEIKNYMENMYFGFSYMGMSFSPGNVINWRDLEFQKRGRVLVEER